VAREAAGRLHEPERLVPRVVREVDGALGWRVVDQLGYHHRRGGVPVEVEPADHVARLHKQHEEIQRGERERGEQEKVGPAAEGQ
jgi:hypothetical protein